MTITECRQNAKLSREEMANMLGIPTNEYIAIEVDPSLMTITEAKLFSKIVNVSIDDIFFNRHST